MKKKIKHPLKLKTKVFFTIGDGIDIGIALITAKRQDPEEKCWYYRLNVLKGSKCEFHRHKNGELWANDFEVRPVSDILAQKISEKLK